MSITLTKALELCGVPFPGLPASARVHALGVPYVHVRMDAGDDLFLSRHGWPWLRELLPENWFANGYFKTAGKRLRFSSGTVYRVPIKAPRRLQIVIKFSRVGQHLDRAHLAQLAVHPSPALGGFASPFEEIANLERLRSAPQPPRVLTKRALAVFSPNRQYKGWQLGRIPHIFEEHARKLRAQSPDESLVLNPLRDYIVVFQWMRGLNLEECFEQGILRAEDVERINRAVLHELQAKGFAVLDHKPNHVIVCVRRDGSLAQRHGRVVYGLADFELLVDLREDSARRDAQRPPHDGAPSHVASPAARE